MLNIGKRWRPSSISDPNQKTQNWQTSILKNIPTMPQFILSCVIIIISVNEKSLLTMAAILNVWSKRKTNSVDKT